MLAKSDSTLYFKAEIVIGVDAGPQLDEIVHVFEVITANSDVGAKLPLHCLMAAAFS